MKDMETAVQRIQQAIEKGESLMVYGDYDVDGTTSVALVSSYLQKHTNSLTAYIPDRYAEGYGLSYAGIDEAKKRGATLVIVLDCGTKAVEKIEYATSLGIDIIICDHHRPGPVLPKAVALLNPKRDDNTYPDTNLSACGVGFKLVQALEESLGGDVTNLSELLDLVAASIASDIVPVLGENRVLATFGLKQINHGPRIAFAQLLGSADGPKDSDATLSDLVFKVGPKINAAGRIEHGMRAVEFLLSENPMESKNLLENIRENNETRRDLDSSITLEALAQVEEKLHEHPNLSSTVVFSPDWHKGVVGIVASRLIENHYKPTIVLTQSGDKIAGSARSVRGFDVHKALDACSEHLEQFGGHMYAAGMTLLPENLEAFERAFEKVVSETLPPELKVPVLEIDAEMDLCDLTPKFYRLLSQFEPFGPENMKPNICSRGLTLLNAKLVGADQRHLKGVVLCPKDQTAIDVIGFGLGEKFNSLPKDKPVDIVYHLEVNSFRGQKSLQLSLKDIKPFNS
ncbi:MAG: single-stranded-DNA-specific exonuclease RecJ [Schleiferiaceae bacterium]